MKITPTILIIIFLIQLQLYKQENYKEWEENPYEGIMDNDSQNLQADKLYNVGYNFNAKKAYLTSFFNTTTSLNFFSESLNFQNYTKIDLDTKSALFTTSCDLNNEQIAVIVTDEYWLSVKISVYGYDEKLKWEHTIQGHKTQNSAGQEANKLTGLTCLNLPDEDAFLVGIEGEFVSKYEFLFRKFQRENKVPMNLAKNTISLDARYPEFVMLKNGKILAVYEKYSSTNLSEIRGMIINSKGDSLLANDVQIFETTSKPLIPNSKVIIPHDIENSNYFSIVIQSQENAKEKLLVSTMYIDEDEQIKHLCGKFSDNYITSDPSYKGETSQYIFPFNKNSYVTRGNIALFTYPSLDSKSMLMTKILLSECRPETDETLSDYEQNLLTGTSLTQCRLFQGISESPYNVLSIISNNNEAQSTEYTIKDHKRKLCDVKNSPDILLKHSDLSIPEKSDIIIDKYKTDTAYYLSKNRVSGTTLQNNKQIGEFQDTSIFFQFKYLENIPDSNEMLILKLSNPATKNDIIQFTIENNADKYTLHVSTSTDISPDLTKKTLTNKELAKDTWYSVLVDLNSTSQSIYFETLEYSQKFDDVNPFPDYKKSKRSKLEIGNHDTYIAIDELYIFNKILNYNEKLCFQDTCMDCLKCQNDQTFCTECEDGLVLVSQPQQTCLYCDTKCKTCKTTVDNCLQCQESDNSKLKSGAPDCLCNDGFYADYSGCLACGPKCATCEQEHECSTCKNPENRETDNGSCNCIIGFYENTALKCEQCRDDCQSCQDGQSCQECKYNRMPDSNDTPNKCVCNDSHIEHDDTPWCTSCEVARIDVKYSPNYLSLWLVFPVDIDIEGTEGIDMCKNLLENIQTRKYGIDPYCKKKSSRIFTIDLGTAPLIEIDDEIEFKPDTKIFQNVDNEFTGLCDTLYISTFALPILKLDEDIALKPQVTSFNKPFGKISVCQELFISVDQIENDGQRGLTNFQWSIKSGPDPNNDIDTFIKLQNLKKLSSIKFPSNILQQNSAYEFELYFENFFGQNNRQTVQIETEGDRAVEVKINEAEQFIFKTWKQNDIEAYLFDIQCGQTNQGGDQEFQVRWSDVTSSPQVLHEEITKKPITTFTSEKYQFSPGTYTYKIDIVLTSDNTLQNSLEFQVVYEQTPLGVFIKGGNRMTGYSDQLKMEGIANDIDVPEDQQQQGITISWTCTDMLAGTPCAYPNTTTITIPNERQLEFPEKTFLPYKTYQFVLTGNKGGGSNTDTVTLIVTENNLPGIEAGVSQQILNQRVNINDDLQMDIKYNSKSENLKYNLAFIYDLETVGKKTYTHPTFSYKIWDLFSDLKIDVSEIKVQVSVIDPNFVMPQQSSFILKLNLPPTEGKFNIDITKGAAITAQFNIQILDFHDEDGALAYQYFYYLSQKDYENEILEGSNILVPYRNIYAEFTTQSQISMTLPRAELNKENDLYQGMVLVQIIDPRGAIKNVTQVIQVNPPDQSIQEQIQNIQTKYNGFSKLSKDEQIQLLNVLVLDLTRINKSPCSENKCSGNGNCLEEDDLCECNSGFFFRDCSMNNKGTQDLYNSVKKELESQVKAYLKENLSKAVKDQLMKSQNALVNDIDLNVELDLEEVKEKLDNTENLLQEQEDIIQDLISKDLIGQGDSRAQKKVNQVKQNLGNSLKLLDGISFGLAKQSESQRRLLQEEEQQQQQSQQQQPSAKMNTYNLNRKTGSILQKLMLPNGDPSQFYGKSLKTQVSRKTTDGLQNDFFNQQQQNNELNEYDFVGFNQYDDGEQQEEEVNTGIPKGVKGPFDASKNAYRANPFQEETGFPYSNQSTQIQEYSIKQQGSDEKVNITSNVNMLFGTATEEQAERATCISKEDDKWNNLNCDTEQVKVDDGVYQTKCKCKTLDAATVVDDVEGLFKDSKVEEVFSNKGIAALSNFKFWYSYIFYIYILKCFILGGCIYKGIQLDKQDAIIKEQRDKEEEIKEKSQKKQELFEKLEKQQEIQQQINLDLKKHENSILLTDQKTPQKKGAQSPPSETKDDELLNFDTSQYILPTKRASSSHRKSKRVYNRNTTIKITGQNSQYNLESYNDMLKNMDNNNSPSKKQHRKVHSTESLENTINEDITSKLSDPNHIALTTNRALSDPEIQDENKQDADDQENQKQNKTAKQRLREISEVLFRLHKFVGIFLVYETDLNRPQRFVLYYLQIHQLLAVSSLFTKDMDTMQTVLLSLISTAIIGIPEAFLQAMLKKKKKLLKYIGLFFYFCIYLTTVFIILTSAALLGYKESNKWTVEYMFTFSLDSFMMETVLNFFKLYLVRNELMYGKSNKIQKLFASEQIINYMKNQV